jgi:hypothetical protein
MEKVASGVKIESVKKSISLLMTSITFDVTLEEEEEKKEEEKD